MKLRAYQIIHNAVERGCEFGIGRAYKYSDTPERDDFAYQCTESVMLELHEIIDFEE